MRPFLRIFTIALLILPHTGCNTVGGIGQDMVAVGSTLSRAKPGSGGDHDNVTPVETQPFTPAVGGDPYYDAAQP